MSWRADLMEALKNKDAEALRKLSEQARNRYQPIAPRFDYKMIEAEGREPGSDDE